MRPAYLAQTIRAAEEPLLESLPGVLMQRAAAGLASAVLRELRARAGVYGARVLLVVGAGNNGGDALYAGARLLDRGVRVRAWRTSSDVHEGAVRAFLGAGGREVDAVGAVAELGRTDLVIDGVLGIGGRPGLPQPVALFARACADARVPMVSVDLPSGLSADSPNRGVGLVETRGVELVETKDNATGDVVSTSSTDRGVEHVETRGVELVETRGVELVETTHFTADLTVTFGGLKFCHVLEPSASACGRIELVDIGLDLPAPDLRVWQQVDVAAVWPWPDAKSDKYSRGVVGIDTGSARYPGAAVLSTLGAVHAGAGMVRFTGAAEASDLVRAAAPNVVAGAGRVQAMVLGSGWGDHSDGAATVDRALHTGLPLVLDADALRCLPDRPLGEQVLLTPHAGELARLLETSREQVQGDPIAAVRSVAQRFHCSVLLKGATQYACTPDGQVTIAVAGPAWTAQAGSGDVLAGVCGTLLAAGLAPDSAALAAASVQALAAAARPGPLPPQDIARSLVGVVRSLRL